MIESMTDAQRTKLAGRRVIASISGGKDSAALSLWLHENGVEHDRVFMDTGWEHEDTYAYLRGPLTEKIGPIVEIAGERKMEELVQLKGMFPSRQRRYCTQELKVYPMQRYIRSRLDAGDDVVNAVGIRGGESRSRSKMPEWEWQDGFDCEVWRPLIRWSEQDVIDLHKRHGLPPNPLYLRGASRVGCWPCIYAKKSEVRMIAEIDPGRIDRIRRLEASVAKAAEARYDRDRAAWRANPDPEPASGTPAHERWAAKKLRLSVPFALPSWFQSRIATPDGRYPSWPIDEVVSWSRTSRGGTQFELFAAGERDAGCMRWGLCETNED